jgi:hypothetical protein
MFEMLTGRQRSRGVVLRNLNANVPPELEQIVARTLAANVETRAQSAAAVAAELRSVAAILDTRTEAEEAAAFAAARRPAAPGRRAGVIALLVLLALVAALATWMYSHGG